VDPSALIFVALAVAWAVYLIPKALEHHEQGARTRTVERFSKTMRVLARREPVNRKQARLVTKTATEDRTVSRPPAPAAPVEPASPAVVRAHRQRAARAAKRRLRVVSVILLANVVMAVLAYLAVVAWVWCAAPLGVLVAWLVACRLMVKRERAAAPVRRIPAGTPAPATSPAETEEVHDATGAVPVVDEQVAEADPETADPESWDPVPVTLPTYVSKPVAPRTVRTIDLDSTGVWSSGRNESDSALAREAEAADRASREKKDEQKQQRRA
jgi:hypothetical protein